MTPLYIAGPCVIETEEQCRTIANEIKRLNATLKTNIIFKASLIKQTGRLFSHIGAPESKPDLKSYRTLKNL